MALYEILLAFETGRLIMKLIVHYSGKHSIFCVSWKGWKHTFSTRVYVCVCVYMYLCILCVCVCVILVPKKYTYIYEVG